MRIAIDIDGVLLDLMNPYCEVFNEKYNTEYTIQDVKHWEFFRDWNIPEKEIFEIFYQLYENSMSIPFIDEKAPDYMRKLNINHEVYIVSTRDPQFRTQTLKKLNYHNIKKNVQYIELILVHHKPYDSKVGQDFDIYVDDNPNLAKSIRIIKNKYLILYDQPWNQNVISKDNIFRVFNWKEVYSTIERLSSKINLNN